jgi:hypothetical protein
MWSVASTREFFAVCWSGRRNRTRTCCGRFDSQRAAGHLVKVIGRADDSNGMIGGLAGDVLELHRLAWAHRGITETTGWQVANLYDLAADLAARDTGGLIDALLTDGDTDEAWHAATSGDPQLASSQWERLAKARERAAPHEAMEVYLRLADDALEQADKRAYRVAVRHLKAARRTAAAADRTTAFREHLAGLWERNRRRPTLISMLDKAGLE